jgi:hypothetical protein
VWIVKCAICKSEQGENVELLTEEAVERHAREIHREMGISGDDLKMLSSPFPAGQVTPETLPGVFAKKGKQ